MRLSRFGSAELKKEFLLPSILGDKVACLGVSEVGAGSDVSSKSLSFRLKKLATMLGFYALPRIDPGIKTKAVRNGDDYVINGGKMWTTNGTQADWMCLLANTGDGPPHRNKSLICLPMNLPGRIGAERPPGAIKNKLSSMWLWFSSMLASPFFF